MPESVPEISPVAVAPICSSTTFTAIPLLPNATPTDEFQVASKTYVDSSEKTVKLSSTTVFSLATPPTSGWTDLDLSSQIGTNQALAFIIVENPPGSNNNELRFRENGSTFEVSTSTDSVTDSAGMQICAVLGYTTQTTTCSAMVHTDSSGVIEWIANSNNAVKVVLKSYLLF